MEPLSTKRLCAFVVGSGRTCNTELPGHLKFCLKCGGHAGSETCQGCHFNLHPRGKFCGQCGLKTVVYDDARARAAQKQATDTSKGAVKPTVSGEVMDERSDGGMVAIVSLKTSDGQEERSKAPLTPHRRAIRRPSGSHLTDSGSLGQRSDQGGPPVDQEDKRAYVSLAADSATDIEGSSAT